MVDHKGRPELPGLLTYTWQIHVTLPREIRCIEHDMTHEEAAKMMKLCRALFPKSVIICSINRETEQ